MLELLVNFRKYRSGVSPEGMLVKRRERKKSEKSTKQKATVLGVSEEMQPS